MNIQQHFLHTAFQSQTAGIYFNATFCTLQALLDLYFHAVGKAIAPKVLKFPLNKLLQNYSGTLACANICKKNGSQKA